MTAARFAGDEKPPHLVAMTPHTTYNWADTVPSAPPVAYGNDKAHPPVQSWYLAPCTRIEPPAVNRFGPFMLLHIAAAGRSAAGRSAADALPTATDASSSLQAKASYEMHEVYVKEPFWPLLDPYIAELKANEPCFVPVFMGDNGKLQFSVYGAAAVARKAGADDDTKYFVSTPTQVETLKLKPTIAYSPLVTRITQDAKLRCLNTTQPVNQILRDHYGIR